MARPNVRTRARVPRRGRHLAGAPSRSSRPAARAPPPAQPTAAAQARPRAAPAAGRPPAAAAPRRRRRGRRAAAGRRRSRPGRPGRGGRDREGDDHLPLPRPRRHARRLHAPLQPRLRGAEPERQGQEREHELGRHPAEGADLRRGRHDGRRRLPERQPDAARDGAEGRLGRHRGARQRREARLEAVLPVRARLPAAGRRATSWPRCRSASTPARTTSSGTTSCCRRPASRSRRRT